MTRKKNMASNRKPRRIHRNKGGRKKGGHLERLKKMTKDNNEKFSGFSWKNWLHP